MSPAKPNIGSTRERFFKYLFILLLSGVNILYIVIFFSNYTVRREIEAELSKAKSDISIDTLIFSANSVAETAQRLQTYRCLQKEAIAFYRFATLDLRRDMADVYVATLSMRQVVREFLVAHAGVVDVEKTNQKLDDAWGVPLPSDLLFRADASFPAQQDVIARFETLVASDSTKLMYSLLRKPALKALFERESVPVTGLTGDSLKAAFAQRRLKDSLLFDFAFIADFEKALNDLKKEISSKALDAQQARNILIRKLAADDALVSSDDRAGLLSELSRNLSVERQNESYLRDLDCSQLSEPLVDELKRRAKAAGVSENNGALPWIMRSAASTTAAPDEGTSFVDRLNTARAAVHDSLIRGFIRLPTAAQTLIVTMLFGSLGALCLQSLRLSNRGYWGTVSDPQWGEIVTSIVLGMAAAVIVYLLTSLGLLLVSDRNTDASQVSTVGAGLVALLGFVSGLLNDDAFGRIRRFGLEVFRGDVDDRSVLEVSGPDSELARRLRDMGCERFAELAVAHRIANRLVAKGNFTFLVPSDATLDALTLAQWRALADTERSAKFDAQFARHLHEGESLGIDELRTRPTLKMADGATLDVKPKTDASGIEIGPDLTVESSQAYAWRDGTFFVVKGLRV